METEWGTWWVRRHFFEQHGYTDAGEQAALEAIAEAVDDADVVDLGVGGGRTSELLAPRARSYVGVDSSTNMVELARDHHPGLDYRVLDARHLEGIPDASADIVVFSNNGIDAVGADGRDDVLDEMARVVRPGGLVQLSTFNLDGGTYGLRPSWSRLWSPVEARGARAVWAAAKRFLTTPMGLRNFRRRAPEAVTGDGWATWPLRPHEYRFVVHFARQSYVVGELRRHGLMVRRIWDSNGHPLDPSAERADGEYFQLVAERTA